MAGVGVSVGDHGPGKGVTAAGPVAPPPQGISLCFGELILQKIPNPSCYS